jgi:hypothetical protein
MTWCRLGITLLKKPRICWRQGGDPGRPARVLTLLFSDSMWRRLVDISSKAFFCLTPTADIWLLFFYFILLWLIRSCSRLSDSKVDVDRAVRSILGRLVWTTGGGGRGAPGVLGAALSGCSHLTDRSLALLARNCPHLERLELQKCRDVVGLAHLKGTRLVYCTTNVNFHNSC